MIKVVAKYEVNATCERVDDLMSDVRALPAWLPGLTSAETLAREGDISVIELSGPALPGGRLVLECVRASAEKIIFAEVDRWRGRGFSGSLSVRRGRTDSACALRVTVQRDGLPLNIASRMRLRRTLDELGSALARRAERTEVPELEFSSARRKILEIVRREGRFYVLVDGASIELPSGNGSAGTP